MTHPSLQERRGTRSAQHQGCAAAAVLAVPQRAGRGGNRAQAGALLPGLLGE